MNTARIRHITAARLVNCTACLFVWVDSEGVQLKTSKHCPHPASAFGWVWAELLVFLVFFSASALVFVLPILSFVFTFSLPLCRFSSACVKYAFESKVSPSFCASVSRAMTGRFPPAVFQRRVIDRHGVVTAAEVQQLAEGLTNNSCVEQLLLSRSRNIADAGVAAIAGCLSGCKVRKLCLRSVGGLGWSGCRALSQGIKDSCVQCLDLGDNEAIGDAGVAALAGCLAECKLKELRLDGVGLGAGGCRALMLHLGCVERLCLAGNAAIGDAGGIEAVAERLTDCGLKSLNLSHVGLSNDGCRLLVQGILGSCVENISLYLNQAIRGEGDEALQVACTIRDELRVNGDWNGFTYLQFANGPMSYDQVVAVVDVICLSGIRPCHVTHPVFMYGASNVTRWVRESPRVWGAEGAC